MASFNNMAYVDGMAVVLSYNAAGHWVYNDPTDGKEKVYAPPMQAAYAPTQAAYAPHPMHFGHMPPPPPVSHDAERMAQLECTNAAILQQLTELRAAHAAHASVSSGLSAAVHSSADTGAHSSSSSSSVSSSSANSSAGSSSVSNSSASKRTDSPSFVMSAESVELLRARARRGETEAAEWKLLVGKQQLQLNKLKKDAEAQVAELQAEAERAVGAMRGAQEAARTSEAARVKEEVRAGRLSATLRDVDGAARAAADRHATRIQALTSSRDAALSDLEAARGDMTDSEGAQHRLTDVERELGEARAQRAQLESRVLELEAELRTQHRRRESAEQSQKALRARVTQCQADAREARQSASDVQAELDAVVSTTQELREGLKNQKSMCQALEQQVVKAESATEKYLERLTTMRGAVESGCDSLTETHSIFGDAASALAVHEHLVAEDSEMAADVREQLGTQRGTGTLMSSIMRMEQTRAVKRCIGGDDAGDLRDIASSHGAQLADRQAPAPPPGVTAVLACVTDVCLNLVASQFGDFDVQEDEAGAEADAPVVRRLQQRVSCVGLLVRLCIVRLLVQEPQCVANAQEAAAVIMSAEEMDDAIFGGAPLSRKNAARYAAMLANAWMTMVLPRCQLSFSGFALRAQLFKLFPRLASLLPTREDAGVDDLLQAAAGLTFVGANLMPFHCAGVSAYANTAAAVVACTVAASISPAPLGASLDSVHMGNMVLIGLVRAERPDCTCITNEAGGVELLRRLQKSVMSGAEEAAGEEAQEVAAEVRMRLCNTCALVATVRYAAGTPMMRRMTGGRAAKPSLTHAKLEVPDIARSDQHMLRRCVETAEGRLGLGCIQQALPLYEQGEEEKAFVMADRLPIHPMERSKTVIASTDVLWPPKDRTPLMRVVKRVLAGAVVRVPGLAAFDATWGEEEDGARGTVRAADVVKEAVRRAKQGAGVTMAAGASSTRVSVRRVGKQGAKTMRVTVQKAGAQSGSRESADA